MTVSIVPFVKSIATKAGEDAYGSVKRLLRKTVKPEKTGDIGFGAWSEIPVQLVLGKTNFVQREGEVVPEGLVEMVREALGLHVHGA